ncbi:hypothetical protein BgiBS90_007408 [Biomphalaria glabrata]|nr:hypothetical protein BgiBS90_007408 [Biomphalaria glabrata]
MILITACFNSEWYPNTSIHMYVHWKLYITEISSSHAKSGLSFASNKSHWVDVGSKHTSKWLAEEQLVTMGSTDKRDVNRGLRRQEIFLRDHEFTLEMTNTHTHKPDCEIQGRG